MPFVQLSFGDNLITIIHVIVNAASDNASNSADFYSRNYFISSWFRYKAAPLGEHRQDRNELGNSRVFNLWTGTGEVAESRALKTRITRSKQVNQVEREREREREAGFINDAKSVPSVYESNSGKNKFDGERSPETRDV